MMEELLAYLSQCPFLRPFRRQGLPYVTVDGLGTEPTQYSIEILPSSDWVRRYTDGGGIKQLSFVFASRECFSGDAGQNAGNNCFYEQFSDWMRQTPPTAAGWIRVEAVTGGYRYFEDGAEGSARYQIQCRVLYSV